MTALLEVRDLAFSYAGGARPIFRDVRFRLEAGGVLCVIGPNGAGKTTLLDAILRLRTPTGGAVLLDGHDMRRLPRRSIARTVAYVPQTSEAPPLQRALDYVVMGRAPYISAYRQPSAEDIARASAALDRLGVGDLARSPCGELSGGQRQQVEIARALAQEPRLILLDEPTSALDLANQTRVLRVVRDLAAEGFAVLFTTHDPNHVVMLDCLTGILGRDGGFRVGTAAECVTSEVLSAVYEAPVAVDVLPGVGRRVCVPAWEEDRRADRAGWREREGEER